MYKMLERKEFGIIIKQKQVIFFKSILKEGYYVGFGSFYGTASSAYRA